MVAAVVVAPIEEGNLDAWRDFRVELAGSRRKEWAQSQRRRGITREMVFLDTAQMAVVIVVEAGDPAAAFDTLGESRDPFDRWYAERLSALHGEWRRLAFVYDSRPMLGSWRGWSSRKHR